MLQVREQRGQVNRDDNDSPGTNPIRSFGQIARMLPTQDGKAMTPLHVMRICRMAEAKLVKALLNDPAIQSTLRTAVALVN